jgi:hypothetical protein
VVGIGVGVGVALAAVALAALAAAPARAAFQPQGLRVDGGEDSWHARQPFALRWSNPPGVAAVHYRVLDPDGRVVVNESTLAGPATAIQHVSVPSAPGAYRAEVWLERDDGSEGEPAGAALRFDDARPGAVAPLPFAGWIGRAAFPLTLRIGHPAGAAPLSGIRGYAVSVDASPSAEPCATTTVCGDAEMDLRGGVGEDALQLGELPEGASYVHAVAVSGSGMRSASAGSTILRVDETDPVTRLAGAPSGWASRSVTLTASASDAASGMAAGGAVAPFTAIRIDGGAPTVAVGDTVRATVIASGPHEVAYYARDAAGNVPDGGGPDGRPNRPPATATVRIDREPPRLAFGLAQDPLDPERIEVHAEDRYSGLDPARGSIGLRRVGSRGRFAELPTELFGGALRARWDSGAYPTGEYEFRAVAFDLAGNSAVTVSRAGGAPMRLRGPLKTPIELLAKARRRSLRYGRGTWFGGRVVVGRRSPLAGAPVQIVERFDAGGVPAERVSMARTDGKGRFGVQLAAGPNRQVIASVAPTRTLRGASSRPLALSVRGKVGLGASSTVARVGGEPVVFRGRVAARGASIPADGKAVELQFRLRGSAWSEFRTIRTDPKGRFRYAYRFADDDSRDVRFQFRAYAPAQAGWPFEPAGSRPVVVRGA